MSADKKISKRQAIRVKRKRDKQLKKLAQIGIIVGAVLVAYLLISPGLKPAGEIILPEPKERPMASGSSLGDPDAPIRIEEFSDFQCPFCARYYRDTAGDLEDTYVADGTVYFVYRSFGSFIGPESGAAAEAAYCAGDQDKFWEYHDVLFANQTGENVGAFRDSRLRGFAEALSLDVEVFNECFDNNTYSDRVEQDFAEGSAAGVTGTPGFIVTYLVDEEEKIRLIAGAVPFGDFQTQIEQILVEMGLK